MKKFNWPYVRAAALIGHRPKVDGGPVSRFEDQAAADGEPFAARNQKVPVASRASVQTSRLSHFSEANEAWVPEAIRASPEVSCSDSGMLLHGKRLQATEPAAGRPGLDRERPDRRPTASWVRCGRPRAAAGRSAGALHEPVGSGPAPGQSCGRSAAPAGGGPTEHPDDPLIQVDGVQGYASAVGPAHASGH
jgi:hypothetical protein